LRGSLSGCYMSCPRCIVSSSRPPLSSDWGMNQKQLNSMDHGTAHLRLSADNSINLHGSGGSSSKQKDPVETCSGENVYVGHHSKREVIYYDVTPRATYCTVSTVTRVSRDTTMLEIRGCRQWDLFSKNGEKSSPFFKIKSLRYTPTSRRPRQ
jgi:hypothetical protein